MKNIFKFLLVSIITSPVFAGIHVQQGDPGITIGSVTISGLAGNGNQCAEINNLGQVGLSGDSCGPGSSSLAVLVNGVMASSPTSSVGFNGSGVSYVNQGTSTTITISGSGIGGMSGQINNSNQYNVPYYSVSGSSNVLSGSNNFQWNGTSVTISNSLVAVSSAIIITHQSPGGYYYVADDENTGSNTDYVFQMNEWPNSPYCYMGFTNTAGTYGTGGIEFFDASKNAFAGLDATNHQFNAAEINSLTGYEIGGSTVVSVNTTDTSIGKSSLVIGSGRNTALGADALHTATTGIYNTAIGYASMFSPNTSSNTAIGYEAAEIGASTANGNTMIGFATGKTEQGSNNVYVGANTDSVSGNLTNTVAIGANIIPNTSNYVYLGNSNTTDTLLNGQVHISSTVLLSGSAGTSGQVLQSNGVGAVPTWATASGGGSSIYSATATASFPFGFSASTGVFTGTGSGNFFATETNAPAGIGSTDELWADSTNHAWIMNNNNTGAFQVVGSSGSIKNGDLVIFNSTNSIYDLGLQIQTSTAGYVPLYSAPGVISGTSTLTVGTFSSSPTALELNVSSASSVALWGVQFNGHTVSSGTNPTAASCGTTPHMAPNSTDEIGAITWAGAATSCAVSFGTSYAAAPFCIANSTGPAVGITMPISTSGPTFNFSSITGGTITYRCSGGMGG